MTADSRHIPGLRKLWQQAFGDSDAVLDAFFAAGFSPDRCNMLLVDDLPVSALYWFDCRLGGHRLAYIYAVATLKSHRGKGLARRLMEETHRLLAARGYAGAILVPGTLRLFAFYRRLGYRTATTVAEFTCYAGSEPMSLREISAAEYTQLRKTRLPSGTVIQEGAALDFLQATGHFYTGEDILLAAAVEDGILMAQEYLGNPQAAPAILRALGCPEGRFRTPGADRAFAMLLPLHEDCPTPSYFGLALD